MTLDALLLASEASELLLPFGPNRHDESPADFQLFEQHLGHSERRSGGENSIERRLRFPPRASITVPEAHVAQLELFDSRFRAHEQRLDALDRVQPLHQR